MSAAEHNAAGSQTTDGRATGSGATESAADSSSTGIAAAANETENSASAEKTANAMAESESGAGMAKSTAARNTQSAAVPQEDKPLGDPTRPIGLLIVDDHPVVRDGLRGMFTDTPGFTVLGEAGDGAQALTMAESLRPDVVLMDLRMPQMNGVTAITRMAERGLSARVLVLTTYDTDSDVLLAIDAGATGYLLKDAPRDELFRAVRAAARGESVLSPSVATRLLNQMRAPARDDLSQRELEVLALISQGSTNREAAARLFISEATVKTHLLHAYAKLGVKDRAAAVAAAFERGLLGG